ncbi:hypothetical protein FCM35_KLT20759 [Carex littledalei]|uniref:TOD1/MUCI70 glycosyltransferase-like domain-containing protein n=1 Tax=Carex littledalei TaxID=544730 RepID=A0A833VNB1_9POAL|nr:hypothetical protein FCM35_KLT20759 [Carex littledalei]
MAQYRQMQPDLRTHQPPVSTGYRVGAYKPIARIRRAGKPYSRRRRPVVVLTLCLAFFLAFLLFRRHSGQGLNSDIDFEKSNQTLFKLSRELRFGQGTKAGRDSRYWDRDDRRRDQDYAEEDSQTSPNLNKNTETQNNGKLYNEGGREELGLFKEDYDDEDVVPEDEYDDGIDAQDDMAMSENFNKKESKGVNLKANKDLYEIGNYSDNGGNGGGKKGKGHEKKSGLKKKPKKHKFSSSTCEMKFLNSTAQLVEPAPNNKFSTFSLNYTENEEKLNDSAVWEPRFAGHQTLQERETSFVAHDQTINCGFVKGPDGSSTGFDISQEDLKYMRSCHIAVSSCIFGNSDRLRSPFGKTITRLSKKRVCFAMFLDEMTLQTLLSEGQLIDSLGFMGLWKAIVVKNLPYNDMRRVGKVPKFLAHRLFPSARYSIWLDSKLRLQNDPILILEYFLWRHEHEYAISNHYDRHCVWDEVVQNKKLNKFNHTIIDQQFEFYQRDGLKRFDPSNPNKLLPSYVPEGSFIVREHTPMSNLFSCLWFNEVERFTPRDQLSFAYTYLKLRRTNPSKPFYLNMFKDCERRSIAKLFHHRAEERHSNPSESMR